MIPVGEWGTDFCCVKLSKGQLILLDKTVRGAPGDRLRGPLWLSSNPGPLFCLWFSGEQVMEPLNEVRVGCGSPGVQTRGFQLPYAAGLGL